MNTRLHQLNMFSYRLKYSTDNNTVRLTYCGRLNDTNMRYTHFVLETTAAEQTRGRRGGDTFIFILPNIRRVGRHQDLAQY